MFYLYQSNRVERLFAELTRVLLQSDSGPLQQEYVVVENPGLAHWVKMQLAQALGIAANIEFPMPSRFFWQIQRSVMPDLASDSIFAKDSLTWLIHECLPKQLHLPEFEPLAQYLNGHEQLDEMVKDRRRFQLAGQIADLYDQYLVYRPDWIEQWSDQSSAQAKDWKTLDGQPLPSSQYWQPLLWQNVLAFAKQQNLPISHRASMLQEFMQQLKNGQGISGLPKQVVFFGFSALPKHQLETLSLLSRHMDVHFMVPNPCQFYWGDVLDEKRQAQLRLRGQQVSGAEAGNALLASLGRMGKEFQRLLLDVEQIEEQQAFYQEETTISLLHKIQDQILQLQQAEQPKEKCALPAQDNSVQIVGCHSPMREVEVLHDHLLDVFHQATVAGESLNPQDIVVMIPDVATYAPYIDAVFSQPVKKQLTNGETINITIPYSISDRPVQAEHPLLTAFSNLLMLPMSRFTLSDVLALLETPAVYRAYDLQEQDLPLLRQWLQQAGVRWGLDGQHRQEQGLPDWSDNTWLAGFKRLLMGYAVSGPEAVFGTLPVTNVEGLSTQLLGHLIRFVEDLADFCQQSQQAQTINQWAQWLNTWLAILFEPSDQEQTLIQHIITAIENWVDSGQRVQFAQAIPFILVADNLQQRLQQRSGSQHFMVGKVNFCTLLPMRSIPFKVVAVLGLNDSDYPRHVPPRAFDLMHSRNGRRLGDRSRRDEDRYLFLEAIVSARDSLWLSYRSRSQKNNESQTASVVLAEFLDYVKAGFYCEGDESISDEKQQQKIEDRIFTQHPLQPFNQQYFSAGSELFSYHQNWYQVHTQSKNIENEDEEVERDNNTAHEQVLSVGRLKIESDVELDDLIRFWESPSRYYLNQTLDVHLAVAPELDDEDEPFALDGLDQFFIKQRWLKSEPGYAKHRDWLAAGRLAFGEIGQRQLDATLTSVQELKTIAQRLMALPQKPKEVSLGFDESSHDSNLSDSALQQPLRLQGWLKDLYGLNDDSHANRFQQVVIHPSKLKGRHMVGAVIKHWAMNAMGVNGKTYVLCQDYAVQLLPLKASQAKEQLAQLMQGMQLGVQQPLPFLANTAWQLHNPAIKKQHDTQAQKTFVGVDSPVFSEAGEREDIHVMRCFGMLENIPIETVDYGRVLFESMVQSEQLSLMSLDELLESTGVHSDVE